MRRPRLPAIGALTAIAYYIHTDLSGPLFFVVTRRIWYELTLVAHDVISRYSVINPQRFSIMPIAHRDRVITHIIARTVILDRMTYTSRHLKRIALQMSCLDAQSKRAT